MNYNPPNNKQTNNNKSSALENVQLVVRVQARIRGWLERRKYKILQMSIPQTKYFKKEESMETLNGLYKNRTKEEYRVHQYQTGARYSGSWKGGLRHGTGNIVWPDGARYEGEWQFN